MFLYLLLLFHFFNISKQIMTNSPKFHIHIIIKSGIHFPLICFDWNKSLPIPKLFKNYLELKTKALKIFQLLLFLLSHQPTKLGCHPSAATHWSIHHQKSSSDSPFQANTEIPVRERGLGGELKLMSQMEIAAQWLTTFSQSGGDSVLGGENVAGRPATLSS